MLTLKFQRVHFIVWFRLLIKIGVRWQPYLTAPPNRNNSAISVTFG